MDGLILYDDDGGEFGPMLDLRSSYDLRTGIFTTAERFERRLKLPIKGRLPRRGLEAFENEESPGTTVADLPSDSTWLVLNGRWIDAEAPSMHGAELDSEEGCVRSAILTTNEVRAWADSGNRAPAVDCRTGKGGPLLRTPWDVVSAAIVQVEPDVEFLGEGGSTSDFTIVGSKRVFVGQRTTVAPGVVFDATSGPIIIGDDCTIGANAVIEGPVSVGAGSKVHALTRLRACNVLGPVTKVGGELGACVFQGYSNKPHDGYLGDSWVGKWVNLGAGTSASNLRNTYGDVKVQLEPDGDRISTGRPFFGSVIGDHVKTAIGTRLMTGTVLGTGSMIASTAPPPSCTRRFSWITDRGVEQYAVAKFMKVAEEFMSRRNVVPLPSLLTRIAALHEQQG
jgi:UDP-N-acetylglucosamine diphosphorylase/glucosamine-1-phosphate N-acetyltransferase